MCCRFWYWLLCLYHHRGAWDRKSTRQAAKHFSDMAGVCHETTPEWTPDQDEGKSVGRPSAPNCPSGQDWINFFLFPLKQLEADFNTMVRGVWGRDPPLKFIKYGISLQYEYVICNAWFSNTQILSTYWLFTYICSPSHSTLYKPVNHFSYGSLKWGGPKSMWYCVPWCSSALLWALRQSSIDHPSNWPNPISNACKLLKKKSSPWLICFRRGSNLKEYLVSLQAPTSPLFQQSHFTHRWSETCIFFMFHVNVFGLWSVHVKQGVCGWHAFAHFLPQLTRMTDKMYMQMGAKQLLGPFERTKERMD